MKPSGSEESAREVLGTAIAAWLEDPESDVVYAERVEGRWAVRMRQEVRDATTVWFTIGQRSLTAEAYIVGALPNSGRVHVLALRRNNQSFRTSFALDPEGSIVLRARVPNDRVTADELSFILAEIYQTVEVSLAAFISKGLRENNP